jgi:S1-C subfamily serine protease
MSDAQPGSGGQEYYTRFRGTVLGPYSVEKLKALRARGQFSRIHEVSTDRKSWSPASSIDDLFASTTSKFGNRSGPQTAVVAAAGPAASGASSATVPTESTAPGSADSGGTGPARTPGPADAVLWYYRIDDQQFGPTATAELQKLIGERRLGRTDIVWRDGLLDWLAVEEVPELTRGGLPPPVRKSSSLAKISRRRTLFRAIFAFLAFLVTGLIVYLTITGKLRLLLSDASPVPPGAVESVAVNSIDGADAERRLGECVGLVVTGVRATLADGTVTEQAHSTGTCFVIDKAGYALTNKHVVEGFQKQLRAELWREKLRKEQLINVEPKLWVFFNDKPVSAAIVDTIENFDVAILRVDVPADTYLRLSSRSELPRGTKVAALGFPALDRQPLSDEEIVQRLTNNLFAKQSIRGAFESRDLEYNRNDGTVSKVSKEQLGRLWIQHTATIRPGNSGGPLLTDDGVVWAINTLRFPPENGQSETPIYYSLSVGQLKKEIQKCVKDVEWK